MCAALRKLAQYPPRKQKQRQLSDKFRIVTRGIVRYVFQKVNFAWVLEHYMKLHMWLPHEHNCFPPTLDKQKQSDNYSYEMKALENPGNAAGKWQNIFGTRGIEKTICIPRMWQQNRQ